MSMEVINYKCPNCSAPMVFGIGSQKWECHFCFSTFTQEEIQNIEAERGSSLDTASWEAEAFPEEETLAFTCPSCGGRMLTDKNTTATFCVYCHNPTVLAGRLTGEYRPARILPFQVERDAAIAEVKKLTRRKPFLPPAFKEAVDKGEVEGLYVPYWLFSGDYQSQLSATGTNYTVWQDSNYQYTKTDIYVVERAAFIPIELLPIDASVRMDDTLLESIEPFRYDQMVPFSMEYLSGHFAETFDVDAATSAGRFQSRAEESIHAYMRSRVVGYQSVTVNNIASSLSNQDNLYALLPVWTLSVKYREKIYTFAMNGQTGKSGGRLPVSTKRVAAWVAGLFASLYLLSVVVGGFFL